MRLRFLNSLVGAGSFAAVLLYISHASAVQVPAAHDAAPPLLRVSSTSVKSEITDVIEAQLRAFRDGDYTRAYSYAAEEFRELFTQADFEMMVRMGYPVIANAKLAEYGLMLDTGEQAVVTVRIRDGRNESAAYQFHLRREDGVWKIAAVTDLKGRGLVV
jgi:hypothetical protein